MGILSFHCITIVVVTIAQASPKWEWRNDDDTSQLTQDKNDIDIDIDRSAVGSSKAAKKVYKRVCKNKLEGKWDPAALAFERKAASSTPPEVVAKMRAILSRTDPESDVLACKTIARPAVARFGAFQASSKLLQNAVQECNHTKLFVKNGDFDVPVLVHTPKSALSKSNNAAVIYAHGGGGVAGTAQMVKPFLSYMAAQTGLVYFNVDYRLAPEIKFPNNVEDFYRVVKYITSHAAQLNIDAKRIAISGQSGGGYIVFGTMVKLAQKDESHLIKLSMPQVPMISELPFGDLAEMTNEERANAPLVRKMWRCIANDFDKDRTDPLFFPSKASDDLLKKMPLTFIWENEFDMFITGATRMAKRLRAAGRLLELCVQPGMAHLSNQLLGTDGFKQHLVDYKKAIQTYLL